MQDGVAPWEDELLVPVMRRHSTPVYEEDLLPVLLTVIAGGAPP
ncbi:hypothetical protein ACFV7Q_11470 [Streptomyces sp. NPDC059851]